MESKIYFALSAVLIRRQPPCWRRSAKFIAKKEMPTRRTKDNRIARCCRVASAPWACSVGAHVGQCRAPPTNGSAKNIYLLCDLEKEGVCGQLGELNPPFHHCLVVFGKQLVPNGRVHISEIFARGHRVAGVAALVHQEEMRVKVLENIISEISRVLCTQSTVPHEHEDRGRMQRGDEVHNCGNVPAGPSALYLKLHAIGIL
eukprot:scaffold71515_cov32-Tisochrysis_lutea.AAC.3